MARIPLRAGFVGPFLAASERKKLRNGIRQRVPPAIADDEQIDQFVEAVETAVDTFNKITAPASEDGRDSYAMLDRLSRAAHTLQDLLTNLDPGTRDLLRQMQGQLTDLGPARVDMRNAETAWWVGGIREASEKLLNRKRSRRPGPKDGPVASLVYEIAISYGQLFGTRPSAAEDGIFADVIGIIFQTCNLRDSATNKAIEIGETRLTTILTKSGYIPGKKPTQGRKPTNPT